MDRVARGTPETPVFTWGMPFGFYTWTHGDPQMYSIWFDKAGDV